MSGDGMIYPKRLSEADYDRTRSLIEEHMCRIERLNEVLKNDNLDDETKKTINETIRVILNGVKNPTLFIKDDLS